MNAAAEEAFRCVDISDTDYYFCVHDGDFDRYRFFEKGGA